MASKFRKLLSFRLDNPNSDIVNSDEIRTNVYTKASSPYNFDKWDIPKANIETIYMVGTFNLQTAFSIKTHEFTKWITNYFFDQTRSHSDTFTKWDNFSKVALCKAVTFSKIQPCFRRVTNED